MSKHYFLSDVINSRYLTQVPINLTSKKYLEGILIYLFHYLLGIRSFKFNGRSIELATYQLSSFLLLQHLYILVFLCPGVQHCKLEVKDHITGFLKGLVNVPFPQDVFLHRKSKCLKRRFEPTAFELKVGVPPARSTTLLIKIEIIHSKAPTFTYVSIL